MAEDMILDGGIMIATAAPAAQQIVYLDFDGELTSYNGEILTIDHVAVEDSGLNTEDISAIADKLNEDFADRGVIFVTKRPANGDFSTIYIGKTSAFEKYGNFAGLAETIDTENLNKSDNAFVMLKGNESATAIADTIAHEVEHIVFGMTHTGSGLAAYAEDEKNPGYIYYYYSNNHTFSGAWKNDDFAFVLSHYSSNRTYVSSRYQSDGGDDYHCIGSQYDSAFDVTINAGNIWISRGGVANDTTVNSGGGLLICYGGVANSTTVNSSGWMCAYGGVANDITVNSGGWMTPYSGGVVNNTTLNSGGSMRVDDGGVANNTTVNSGCWMGFEDGGVANDIVISSGGYVASWKQTGEVAATITQMKGSGITGVATNLNGTCSMTIASGGVANSTTVNSGGSMVISSGGVMNSTTLNSGGSMRISSGGVANDTTVNSGGSMRITSGGVANSTTVNSGGEMYITSGCVANNTTVNSGGEMYIGYYLGGGVANSTTVNSGGRLWIASGGTATDIVVAEGGGLGITVAPDTYIQWTSNGSAFEMKDASFNGYTLNSGGRMNVEDGGVANSTTVNSGDMRIDSGGVANNTTVNSGGGIYISSGGVANDTTVNSGGRMTLVCSGGVANSTILNSGGRMSFDRGGVANSTTVNSGGGMNVKDGGVANDTTVNSGGWMYIGISSGGVANNTTVNSGGSMRITSGGVANNTTVNSGGSMVISSGGILSGTTLLGGQMICSGTVDATDAEIIFAVDQRTTDDAAIISNLANISGGNYTIQVDPTMEQGIYKLAGNAANFTEDITLTVSGGKNAGTFKWSNGQYNTIDVGGTLYTLSVDQAKNLCLKTQSKISIDFSVDEIGQVVYSNKEKLLEVPYIASTKITFGKNLSDGIYDFSVTLDDIQGAEQKFQIQIDDGVPFYISSDACYFGQKISETDTENTWIISNINDSVLTDIINSEITLTPKYGSLLITGAGLLGVVALLSSCSNDVNAEGGSDANKDGLYLNYQNEMISGKYSCSIIPIDTDNDDVYDKYSITVDSYTYEIDIEKYKENEVAKLELKTGGAENAPTVPFSATGWVFAKKQVNHCWIAVAANMLYTGGYLKDGQSAQECFEYLSDKYYETYQGSVMKSVKDVFRDVELNSIYKIHSDIQSGLEMMASQETTSHIGCIGFDKHGVTCYSVKLNSKKTSGTVKIADSDYEIDRETITTCKIRKNGGRWQIEYNGEFHDITEFESIIANTTEKRYDYKDIKPKKSNGVTSYGAYSVVEGYVENIVLTGEDILEITEGANAENIALHGNTKLKLNSGSSVSGEINTFGGVIVTEDEINFTDTTINFVISQMEDNENVMLDNLENIKDAVLQVTVIDDQAEGKYILAGGAANFTGELTIVGNYDDSYILKEGFTIGELGTLKVGEQLKIGKQIYSLDTEDDTLVLSVKYVPCSVLEISASTLAYVESTVDIMAVFSDDIVVKEYSRDGKTWDAYDAGVTMTANGIIYFRGADAAGNYSEIASYEVNNIVVRHNGGNVNGITLPEAESGYIIEYWLKDFQQSFSLKIDSNQLDTYGLSHGNYSWQCWTQDTYEWKMGNEFTVQENIFHATVWKSDSDGNTDLFFTENTEKWAKEYQAVHRGILNDWQGTGDSVGLSGKNKIADIFEGSTDANVLLLTDGENGDALFADDIFSAAQDNLNLTQARIANLDEIRAGAGDDVVDMTSQRFAYVGDGVTIYGGDGDDVIWSNKGDNKLFGDAGNDRIVGASGNDVIVGGAGDDTLHGGGGDDIFCFGSDWGIDTVEQLSGGTVMLWFEDGSEENWNADTRTYTDGENTVTVSGTADVTLKFGGDVSSLPEGIFSNAVTKKIFESTLA